MRTMQGTFVTCVVEIDTVIRCIWKFEERDGQSDEPLYGNSSFGS